MSPTDLVLERIENDLVLGIGHYQRRRQRQIRTAVTVVVVSTLALAAVGLTGLRGGGPQTALAITVGPDSLTVRVNDAAANAGEMTTQLRDAGANVVVRSEPVEPDAIGEWIASGTLGAGSPSDVASIAADLAQQIREHPAFVTIPKNSPIQILLVVGRSPRTGEQPCSTPTTILVSPGGSACTSPRGPEAPASGP